MWWEFGEHAANLLNAVGLTEERWNNTFPRLLCRCEARRLWMNQQGERLWKWLFPADYWTTVQAIFPKVLEVLQDQARPTSQICDILSLRFSGGPSARTVDRWLEPMVQTGLLVTMTQSGTVNGQPVLEKWYSLRP